jgi:hypothetical protein
VHANQVCGDFNRLFDMPIRRNFVSYYCRAACSCCSFRALTGRFALHQLTECIDAGPLLLKQPPTESILAVTRDNSAVGALVKIVATNERMTVMLPFKAVD